MKRPAWTRVIAWSIVWVMSLVLIGFGVYSIRVIGLGAANLVIIASGMAQVVLALKWPRAAFKAAAVDLFLGQLLLFGYFFTPPESNTPGLDLRFSWMVGLYFFLMIVSLMLAKICLDESRKVIESESPPTAA